ncbi:hypothetical protein [Portibacter lacus]|uniref:Quinol:cytochrome C oxidoreductase n=1 Tax=Portibacter lacus TaxID=1099794 RepID=A0AA37SU18_9BACT|nr:hypothetical protein [Portibacter lacus]GLR19699.1 hypothetical protein GCM10007940_43150 [Portibacter lacus]
MNKVDTMNEYTFTGKSRLVLMIGMGLGLLCLALSFFMDGFDHHPRFWSNLLHNSVFFTGIAFMAVFFISVCITAWAGWYTVFKRVWEAFSQFIIVGLVLMLIIGIGIYADWHHLYHWSDTSLLDPSNTASYDEVLDGKSAFLNPFWYVVIGGLIVAAWVFFAYKLRSLSLDEDVNGGDAEFKHHRKMRFWAAAFLPIAGFSSAAIIWLWVMSVDPHWYSTLFAWYTATSWFVSMLALTILVLVYLKGKGYFANVSAEHFHDLGKFMFAFSIFWTYLWFSQYMLIWYANVGEETIYFKHRIDNYPVMFYGNLIINFLVPFFILMRNDTKRKFGTLVFVSIILIFGHWWDFFLMLKPGILHTAQSTVEGAHHAGFVAGFSLPGLIEIGTMIGFLSLFLFVALTVLSKNTLLAKNDPFLEESLHHHV